MRNNNLSIEIDDIRSIKHANIALDGISVIAGINGCGKSTISKLLYNLVKITIDYDKVVYEELELRLKRITRTLERLTMELPTQVVDKESYRTVQRRFRRLLIRYSNQPISKKYTELLNSVDFLIELFKKIQNEDGKKLKGVIGERIKRIISRVLSEKLYDENQDIITLLYELRKRVKVSLVKTREIIEKRPSQILNEKLREVFEDSPIPDKYNLFEYGAPIIDKRQKKILPIDSIRRIAYIDTPMILGMEISSEVDRTHWEDLNKNLFRSRKSSINSYHNIDNTIEEILEGEIQASEEEFGPPDLLYKRKDGKEFILQECATGLKSMAILQTLLKNGFLHKDSFLIIDEPEAHLHPKWVVEYARLIVFLNQRIGVRFLIASHHPDMISALKYISEKEKNSDRLNFYLAESDGDFQYNYTHLGVEIEKIFESFNIALERIDLYGKTEKEDEIL